MSRVCTDDQGRLQIWLLCVQPSLNDNIRFHCNRLFVDSKMLLNIVLISGFSLGPHSWFAFTCSMALYKEHRTHFFRNQYKFYFFSLL